MWKGPNVKTKFLENFGVFIIMDVKVTQSQLNRVTNILLDRYFGNLTPIKGNVDYTLIYLNESGEVIVGITGSYPKDKLNDYIDGKIKLLKSNDEVNYGTIKPSAIKNILTLLPFIDVSQLKSIMEKYFRKRYGVKADLSLDSTYNAMYINREQKFLDMGQY